jgi:uncharacterized protein (TIGR03437 family)
MRSTLYYSLALFALAAAPLQAQPVVAALQNNYSYALPGTPSYGIAQGSIFVIYGSNMAPAQLMSQGFNPALNRNLGGVSIKVTVAGVTTEAIPYYVSAAQIAAILPSATPVGDGTITVTYNGQTSAPKPIKVVASAFGILTLSGAGTGTAAVYDAAYHYVTLTSASNPGQTVIFWGTGLGAFGADETQLISNPSNLNIPIEFYIGGKRATVLYAGRSAYPGLDQINVMIPAGVSGCYVGAYVKIGAYISNFVTIPVATNGSVCTENNGLTSSQVQQILSGQTVSAGWLFLGKFQSLQPEVSVGGVVVIPGGTTTADSATAQFLQYTPLAFANYGGQGQASIGSCVVSTYRSDNVFTPPFVRALDAGTIRLHLPGGATQTLQKGEFGLHSLVKSTAIPGDVLFIPDTGGTFQFEGTGGADVGAFQASVTLASPLVWTNKANIKDVIRANSLDVTWTGGQPNSYVLITGSSSDGGNPALLTTFTCTENVAAGHFTIPAAVLSSLVASFVTPEINFPTGQLALANYSNLASFNATGLNLAGIGAYFSSSIVVNYK